MEKESFAEDIVSYGSLIVQCIAGKPSALAELSAKATDKGFTFFQRWPYQKVILYIQGVKKAEDDLGSSCRLSNKLFSDPEKSVDNALRIIKYVSEYDSDKKLKWFINATRALLMDLIDDLMLFRIFRAIDVTLAEDLEYLSSIIEKAETIVGNVQVQALSQSNLTILAGMDAKASVEEQDYTVTELGFYVDRFALSLDDGDRQLWYRNAQHKKVKPNMPGEIEVHAVNNEDGEGTLVFSNISKT